MEKQILEMFEKASTDKTLLKMFKEMAVKAQNFELASSLRAIETLHFSETEETKKEKDDALAIAKVLYLIGFNLNEDTAWIISQAIRKYDENKDFSCEDANKLIKRREELF